MPTGTSSVWGSYNLLAHRRIGRAISMKLELIEIKPPHPDPAGAPMFIAGDATSEEAKLINVVITANADMVARSGATSPWVGYLCKSDGVPVGSCAFKGPPNSDAVEIAYFTFPRHRSQGVAKLMACELLKIASSYGGVTSVIAHTLP